MVGFAMAKWCGDKRGKGDAWNRYESQWYSSAMLRIAKEKRRNAQKRNGTDMRGTALQRISEAEKSQGRAVKRTAQQWNSLEKRRIAMEEHGLDKQSIKQNKKIGGI